MTPEESLKLLTHQQEWDTFKALAMTMAEAEALSTDLVDTITPVLTRDIPRTMQDTRYILYSTICKHSSNNYMDNIILRM